MSFRVCHAITHRDSVGVPDKMLFISGIPDPSASGDTKCPTDAATVANSMHHSAHHMKDRKPSCARD